MWTNFHTHTHYCDGKNEPREYIANSELLSLGFSSHAPLPFPCAWCMKPEKLENYLTEINALKINSAQEVYTSLEIDFIPGIISPRQFANRLDYTIGSIHFTEKLSTGKYWEIDGTHSFFLEGLKELFNNNIQHAVTRYFELTREMIQTANPTIVGHLDKIKIQNKDDALFSETAPWYRNEVLETLNLIQDAGTIVEVNTRGLYQKKSHTPYPSPWILELLYQKNIPITLNSDAHHVGDLTNQFSETAVLLRKIGFKKLSILREGKWVQHGFDQYGLVRN